MMTNPTCINASLIDWIKGDEWNVKPPKILSIVEISDMRVRDIKRRLSREYGYGADEIAKILDKKELINALSYEEHRKSQKEDERKKRVALRRSIIVALLCVIIVVFRPLLVHAWEVLCVNIEVYTDKKKYELSVIRELHSSKAAFGLFLTVIVNLFQLWLSVSVLLSWVMKSSYFFLVPYIPLRPAELLATATGTSGSVGALGKYGINIGPMIISWLFRYTNGTLENFMGRELQQRRSEISKQQRKASKAAKKEAERQQSEILRQERKEARRARRAEREIKKNDISSEGLEENEDEKIFGNRRMPAKQPVLESYQAMDELD